MSTINATSSIFADMENLFPLTKTLRFELKPVGKTLENFLNTDTFNRDRDKASSRKEMQNILDEEFKNQIEESLKNVQFDAEKLEEYFALQSKKKQNRNDKDEKDLEKLEKSLKKEIIKSLKRINDDGKELSNEKVIKKIRVANKDNANNLKIIAKFDKFSTYLTRFFKNREHVFKGDSEGSISL